MDKQAKQPHREAFERLCRDRGRPLTLHRRLILESRLHLDNHPTANQIHDAVAGRLPRPSARLPGGAKEGKEVRDARPVP